MANHKSAEKRARQAERRRQRNRHARGQARTLVKAFHASLSQGDAGATQEALRAAEAALRQAGSKGVLPKQRVNRIVSRLAKRSAAAGTGPA